MCGGSDGLMMCIRGCVMRNGHIEERILKQMCVRDCGVIKVRVKVGMYLTVLG